MLFDVYWHLLYLGKLAIIRISSVTAAQINKRALLTKIMKVSSSQSKVM